MTEVQVYEGEGSTPDILTDEITDLILKAHPEAFTSEDKAYVKERAVHFVNTIVENRKKLSQATDYLDNAATDEVLDPDLDKMKEFERHFGPEPTEVDGNEIANSGTPFNKFKGLAPEKTAIDWGRLTKEQLTEVEDALGPVNRNIEESNDSSPSV